MQLWLICIVSFSFMYYKGLAISGVLTQEAFPDHSLSLFLNTPNHLTSTTEAHILKNTKIEKIGAEILDIKRD